MSKRKQLHKTYDEFIRKHGRIPTGTEVAMLLNTTNNYACEMMRLEGLAYSSTGKAMPTETEIREAYNLMKEELGIPPRIDQIAQRLGMKEATVRLRLKVYGLPHTHMSISEVGRLGGQKSCASRAKRKTDQTKMRSVDKKVKQEEKKPIDLGLEAERNLRQRIYKITHSGDETRRPQRLNSPGEGYAPTQRIMVVCEVCGRQVWIAPRMHPYWLRDYEGNIHWVCSDVCTGNMARNKIAGE